MIRYYFILLALLFFTNCKVSVPTPDASSSFDINENVKQVYVDNLENLYILTRNSRIVKYNNSLVKEFEFANNTTGTITSIDATNPQKILAFIPDFNKVLILDNTLALINEIALSFEEYPAVSAVARSNDNKLWLFDQMNQRLLKVNDLGNPELESNRLTDYNLESINPIIVKERENKVFVSDPDRGIYIFDNYGQYLKSLPEQEVYDFQVQNGHLIFLQQGILYQYETKRYEKSRLMEVDNSSFDVKLTKNKKYLISQGGIDIKAI